ncbi:MAG: hypothetical protein ACT4QG_23120 [Sporichthyaceae bacterium]
MSRTIAQMEASRARLAAMVGATVVVALGLLTFLVDGKGASAVGFVLALALLGFAIHSERTAAAEQSEAPSAPRPVEDTEAQRRAHDALYALVSHQLPSQVDLAATPTWARHLEAAHNSAGSNGSTLAVVDSELREDADRRRAEVEQVMQSAMQFGYLAAKAGWSAAPVSRVRWTEGDKPVIEFLRD